MTRHVVLAAALMLAPGAAFAQAVPGDDAGPGSEIAPGAAADSDTEPDPETDRDIATVPEIEPDTEPEVATAELSIRRLPRVQISGYVQPAVAVRYRPQAVPLDRWDWGAEATRTGVILTGAPFSHWSYVLHIVVGSDIFETLTSIDVVDRDGDGSPEEVDANPQSQPGLLVEQATATYAVNPILQLSFGQMRIPFTVQNQSPNTALMFPSRSGPNEVFLSGTDLGGLVTLAPGYGLKVEAGVFNGTDVTSFMNQVRGVLYALRVDAAPLGPFPFGEGDPLRGPLRVGIGAGLLYFPAKTFDSTGFPGASIRDLRASASVRLAYRGLYLQAEVLRRQRTDSLSSRPVIATGGYGQISYYVPAGDSLGIAPIARWGITAEDQSFATRKTMWTEAGFALYIHPTPQEPNRLKLTLHYLDERRLTENENAHGAVAQLQLRF